MARETKAEKIEREETAAKLREWLPPGSTVFTTVTHVAKSGMSRRIRCFRIVEGDILDVSGYVSRVLGYRRHERDGGLIVGGCGMDMGFHIVHCLSYALHGRDSVGAEAQEASSQGRPFSPKPDNYRAGYSLIHRWI